MSAPPQPAVPSATADPTCARKRDYYARVPARFLKDPALSPDAKLLRVLLAAFADERTRRTFVSLRRIEKLMDCGRRRRERAQRELVAAGWLHLERERTAGGWLGRVTFLLCEPPLGHFTTVVARTSPNTSMPTES